MDDVDWSQFDRPTFAALDEEGWHEPGTLVMFGGSTETPEDRAKFAAEFNDRFIKPCAPDDLLVIVDYHC